MSDILAKLFGSQSRVKLLRLFLFNPAKTYTSLEAATHARADATDTRRELVSLTETGLIKTTSRGGIKRYGLNETHEYRAVLAQLLLNAPAYGSGIHDRVKQAGAFKLIVLAGIFMGEWEGNIDILFVGDRVNDKKLKDKIRQVESELGKQLQYALLTTQDFYYRYNMNDRLIRDTFDYPHKVVFDRLHVELN